ncbi:MAG TPA: N-acetylglucosamine-6-phosphate deacetylase [Acidobacteriaceae bacterium]|nr:N-acetylglucosamine-6-phosphate deacetylase [Acidobacteriaceae bacterium]
MQTITARHLITDIGSVEFAVLTITPEGTIGEIYSDPRALHDDQTTLTAAFLDVHTHGAMGHDVMSASSADLSDMQRFLASRGVAHYLPTTVTAPVDATLRALEALADAIEAAPRDGEAQPIGIHLEGPFLSHAKRGVHPPALLQPPSIELFDRFYAAARGHIRLMTIAPEPDAAGPMSGPSTAVELIAHAAALGVKISLGHSNATAAETLAAIDAGATSATHTFNAMRALDHREPGILGIVLDDDRLFAELICDGVHVEPPVVRLWLRAKSETRAILVTDAMSAAGMPDGDYMLGQFSVSVANGRAQLKEDIAAGKETLAGSVLTMERAVANLQAFTHAPLGVATRLASHNPAAMLGVPEVTRLAPGSVANLNRFDEQGRLIATYIRGREI